MTIEEIFHNAIQTGPSWRVIQIDQQSEAIVIHIGLIEPRQAKCPECGAASAVEMSSPYRIRYFPFFQYKSFIEAPHAWVHCPRHGKQRIEHPWERVIDQSMRNSQGI